MVPLSFLSCLARLLELLLVSVQVSFHLRDIDDVKFILSGNDLKTVVSLNHLKTGLF